MDLDRKHMAWLETCRELDVDDYTYTEELATLFIPVMAMDTILEIGEDPEETGDEVKSSLRECLEKECGVRGASIYRIDSRLGNNHMGASIAMDPSDFSDEQFGESCRALIEAIMSFMS